MILIDLFLRILLIIKSSFWILSDFSGLFLSVINLSSGSSWFLLVGSYLGQGYF